MTEARSRAVAALGAASLGHLVLSAEMFPVRETTGPVTWRFGLMDPSPCEGVCARATEGEQVGWLIVVLDGEVAVEALGHVYDLAAFASVRAREKQQARRLAKLPVMESFCRWVVQQGAQACTMWIEEAPAPDCASSCSWHVYVGASNGVSSSRHFTLVVDERTGQLSVRDLDGTVEPMATYRARNGF